MQDIISAVLRPSVTFMEGLRLRTKFIVTGIAGGSVMAYLLFSGEVAGVRLTLTAVCLSLTGYLLLGAYLFGGVTMLQFHLQGVGVEVPSQFLGMMPYLATIVVLALISRNPQWIRANMPASIGKPFYPGS